MIGVPNTIQLLTKLEKQRKFEVFMQALQKPQHF